MFLEMESQPQPGVFSRSAAGSEDAKQTFKISVDTYSPELGFEGEVALIDEENDMTYTVFNEDVENPQINARWFWMIPLGLGFAEEIITVLLVAGSAIVIADVAHVALYEAADKIRKNSNKYYSATLKYDDVWVGNQLTSKEAQSVISSNSKTIGVVCSSPSVAYELCSRFGAVSNPERSGGDSLGFYWHCHAEAKRNAHAWFVM